MPRARSINSRTGVGNSCVVRWCVHGKGPLLDSSVNRTEAPKLANTVGSEKQNQSGERVSLNKQQWDQQVPDTNRYSSSESRPHVPTLRHVRSGLFGS